MTNVPIWVKWRSKYASGPSPWEYDLIFDAENRDPMNAAHDFIENESYKSYYDSEMFRGFDYDVVNVAEVPFEILERNLKYARMGLEAAKTRIEILEKAIDIQRLIGADTRN